MGKAQPKVIGPSVRQYRMERGMTQEELGEVADVAPETISRIERNRLAASLDLTRRLADALGTGVDALLHAPRPGKRSALRPAEARLLHLVRHLDETQINDVVVCLKRLMDLGKVPRRRLAGYPRAGE